MDYKNAILHFFSKTRRTSRTTQTSLFSITKVFYFHIIRTPSLHIVVRWGGGGGDVSPNLNQPERTWRVTVADLAVVSSLLLSPSWLHWTKTLHNLSFSFLCGHFSCSLAAVKFSLGFYRVGNSPFRSKSLFLKIDHAWAIGSRCSKEQPWANHSRRSLKKCDLSESLSLLFKKEPHEWLLVIRSFAHKKRAIRSKNQRANSKPGVLCLQRNDYHQLCIYENWR